MASVTILDFDHPKIAIELTAPGDHRVDLLLIRILDALGEALEFNRPVRIERRGVELRLPPFVGDFHHDIAALFVTTMHDRGERARGMRSPDERANPQMYW